MENIFFSYHFNRLFGSPYQLCLNVNIGTTDIKEMNKILSAISRNINQIAKRLNAGGSAYAADIQEIRERQDEIWQLQRHILSKQR